MFIFNRYLTGAKLANTPRTTEDTKVMIKIFVGNTNGRGSWVNRVLCREKEHK